MYLLGRERIRESRISGNSDIQITSLVALAARDASTPPDGVGRNNGCRDTWGGGGIYGDTVQRFGGWYSVR